MTETREWVDLATWKADAPIVQALTAATVWPTLTERQRELVASCRSVVNPRAKWPRNYSIEINRLKTLPMASRKSLERKGVVDEFGRLTVPGIYTALWNQLDADYARKARKLAAAGEAAI